MKMKRLMIALMCFVLFLTAAMPISTSAQTHRRRYHRSFWHKHRDKLTTAAGAGAGALIGGIAKGKKGAAIGALAGGGGSALYTYKIRKRHRRY